MDRTPSFKVESNTDQKFLSDKSFRVKKICVDESIIFMEVVSQW